MAEQRKRKEGFFTLIYHNERDRSIMHTVSFWCLKRGHDLFIDTYDFGYL
ncbi:hypothetical protein [Metabacillus iocasae]|uniref:Uncharacterized protein n=1 Tax=Priestia iocasae TaxID=2291674 RepID=A0ABS2QSB3_9BACI|nr:hypothetical protein [Metabacillus iocasae]MBM7702343.1 hypothetical protein [Metabacillus iocasae]